MSKINEIGDMFNKLNSNQELWIDVDGDEHVVLGVDVGEGCITSSGGEVVYIKEEDYIGWHIAQVCYIDGGEL